MKIKYQLSFLLIQLFLANIFAQTNDWILKRDQEGVKVYYRDAVDSDIKELRMVFKVKTSLSSIVAVLSDLDAYPSWVYKLDKVKLVEQVSPSEMYYYNLMDFPWPMSDRDLIARSITSQDPVTKVVTSHSLSAHHRMPRNEDHVRIEVLDIKWILMPQPDGTINIDYVLKSDPGGNLPAWLVNLAIDQGPLETVRGFKAMLNKEPFRSARLAFIQELN